MNKYYKYSKNSRRMNSILFWRMRVESAELVFTEGDYAYYSMTLNGYSVMFCTNRYRPDGLRLFLLGDELAKALGFFDYECMRECVPTLQYSRKMLSVQAIERHFR